LISPFDPLSQANLLLTGNSGIALGSRAARSQPPCVKALKVISRMRGGSQSRLMLGDDRNLWVVKFKNNPQHLRVLANELMATQIAEEIGLPVPVSGIIDVSQSLIEGNPQMYIDRGFSGRELCSSGLQFGSQFAGGMLSGQVTDSLAEEQLLNASNVEQFAGILAFDKWTGNDDCRQVVYRRNGTRPGYSVVFIDQGACFNSGEWIFRDAPLKGVYSRDVVYSSVTGWDSFEPWLSKIENFDPASLGEIAAGIPKEWYGEDTFALNILVERLISRRGRVRDLIQEFRYSSRVPFPNWRSQVTTALPYLLPRCRKRAARQSALIRPVRGIRSANN
jgi:hypothetical protein